MSSLISSNLTTTTTSSSQPNTSSKPAETTRATRGDKNPTNVPEKTPASSPQKYFRPGPYPSTWLLQSRNDLDDAFERAWAAYTAMYNREFKTRTSTDEIRERVMAGRSIHGEGVLLPRPAVEYRLTRRKRRVGGHGTYGVGSS